MNRLTNLADGANQNFPHSYDAANRLTARSAPNGITSSYAYDGLSRLTALTHAAGANTLIGNLYTYNDANSITSWTNASGNHAYGYDPVDRLTSATNSAQSNENYSYDGVGNRASSHLSASYSYQPLNKLTSSATASYTYDNNGNLLSKTDSSGTTNFTWNEENQLTQVSLPGGLTVNYQYDGLGRRIQRTTSAGASERYVYDGADVLLDLNADWSVATTYLSDLGIDNKLRQTSSTTSVSYFLTDHLGSTAGLTNASGSIVEQVTYDSFGNSVGSTRTRYGYTGRERDPDTGLLYYRGRFYDPQVGRFISEDPIRFRGDINWYSYVGNNPLRFIDPTGTQIRSDRNFRPDDLDPTRRDHSDWSQSAGRPFNDGGIFSAATFSEFISANERARQPCKKFGERFWESFSDTNRAVPGLLAPTGTGVLTSSKLADIAGEPTPFQWIRNGFRPGSASGGVITRLGFNFVLVGGAYESGVAVGSFIDAAGCPCGY